MVKTPLSARELFLLDYITISLYHFRRLLPFPVRAPVLTETPGQCSDDEYPLLLWIYPTDFLFRLFRTANSFKDTEDVIPWCRSGCRPAALASWEICIDDDIA